MMYKIDELFIESTIDIWNQSILFAFYDSILVLTKQLRNQSTCFFFQSIFKLTYSTYAGTRFTITQ